MDKILLVEYEKCLGCHSCRLACAVEHTPSKDLLQSMYNGEQAVARLMVVDSELGSTPMHCRHCDDAPCLAVCPSGAITREIPDGPVTPVPAKCIGCNACVIVCPFGVIQPAGDGKTYTKCDLCLDRLKVGKDPACVTACPTGAIRFVSVRKINAEKQKKILKEFQLAAGKSNSGPEDQA